MWYCLENMKSDFASLSVFNHYYVCCRSDGNQNIFYSRIDIYLQGYISYTFLFDVKKKMHFIFTGLFIQLRRNKAKGWFYSLNVEEPHCDK